MRMRLNEIAYMLPSLAYAFLPAGIAYYFPDYRNLVLLASFLLGLGAYRLFKIQTNLAYLGFRLVLLSPKELRLIGLAYLLGGTLRGVLYYRGYSFARLKANASFIASLTAPILAARLYARLSRIAFVLASIYAIAIVYLSVRRVRGFVTDRLSAPYGASIGAALGAYFFYSKLFRVLSVLLLGIVPLAIALASEIKSLLALKKVDQ